MRRVTAALFTLSATLLLPGCDDNRPLEPLFKSDGLSHAAKAPVSFATLISLPALSKGVHGEAYGVNRTGTVVTGYSWDRAGRMNPARWTPQNGGWAISALPYPSSATSATARAVNDQGDIAGNDFPSSAPHAILWPATGGFETLGCGALGEGYAISAAGRTVVGIGSSAPGTAAMWQPGSCREDLPPLVSGASATARAVNGDATVIGGSAEIDVGSFSVPVRWRRAGDSWQIEQLDARAGSVYGANASGDLVGAVQVSCAPQSSCSRGIIWYAAGGSRDIGTLGGESTTPRAINSSGEVVGLSALANGAGTAFLWSETLGMRQLPVSDGAWAFGVSDVRSDGTRLVVGAGGRPFGALLWVVRNP
jgi:probable HAF family extracellular repeat protein